MTKEIILTKGKVALVDDEDYYRLSQWNWYTHNCGYATRHISRKTGIKNKLVLMHREILNAPNHLEVDHINGNRLDNRKSNLRLCTRSQNEANRTKYINATSKYKGVYWDKFRNKWAAQIMVNRKHIGIGRFDNELDAVLAYDAAAIKYFGEFAVTNAKGR